MIEPKVLKGFRDSMPDTEIVRQNLVSKVTEIFRNFGFVPIDTPVLEYTEVLLGKGGGETDKQMFRFNDNGGRDVAMRFDLTVPLARFCAANASSLQFPFKRYHIAKVWRGENPQKGRYREFTQCDFDIVGADNTQSDFEILLLIHTCLTQMNVGKFKVSVSHRGLLNLFLSNLGIQDKGMDVLRAIDKLNKIGLDGVNAILMDCGLSEDQAKALDGFIAMPKDSFGETLALVRDMFGDCDEVKRLSELHEMMVACGIDGDFILDTSITRGLDYYTGIVYETLLVDMPQIGSICSGGRYNNLAGLYTKENLPGVGSCIGLDRLIAALEELDSPIVRNCSYAQVMVMKKDNPSWSESTALLLRKSGIQTDCYIGGKGPGQQFAYAEKNHIPFVVMDYDGSSFTVKEIATRKISEGISLQQLSEMVKNA